MKRWTTLFAALLMATSLRAAGDSEAFKALYEKEWAFRLKEFPELASSVGVHEYDDRLTHVALADQTRRYGFWKEIRASLDAISCERLDRTGCINYRIFKRQLDQAIADFEIRGYLIPFNSDWGFYMAWTRLPGETDFVGLADYQNYLSRPFFLVQGFECFAVTGRAQGACHQQRGEKRDPSFHAVLVPVRAC